MIHYITYFLSLFVFECNNKVSIIRILNPLVFGDYPKVMKTNAGSRIPSFTKAQSKKLQGSFDFIGINHYTSVFVVDTSNGTGEGPRDFMADMFSALTGTVFSLF